MFNRPNYWSSLDSSDREDRRRKEKVMKNFNIKVCNLGNKYSFWWNSLETDERWNIFMDLRRKLVVEQESYPFLSFIDDMMLGYPGSKSRRRNFVLEEIL